MSVKQKAQGEDLAKSVQVSLVLFTGVVYERAPAEAWSPVSAEERPDAGPDVPLIFSPSHPFSSLQPSPESSQTLHSTYDPPCNTKKQTNSE